MDEGARWPGCAWRRATAWGGLQEFFLKEDWTANGGRGGGDWGFVFGVFAEGWERRGSRIGCGCREVLRTLRRGRGDQKWYGARDLSLNGGGENYTSVVRVGGRGSARGRATGPKRIGGREQYKPGGGWGMGLGQKV